MGKLEAIWCERMLDAMKLQYPDIPEQELSEIIHETYHERVKDTTVQMYNSYEEVQASTSLIGMVDWMQDTNPLIAESGVFFYQKDHKRNVNTEIIKECMLDVRKIHKKEKFAAIEAGNTFLASVKDLQQANDKKAANSGYGAEGESSSFLYNIHSAISVTASGRGQLSTACQCFENLLADNVKFFLANEFYTWIYNITHEKPERKFKTWTYLPEVTEEQFTRRYMNKMGTPDVIREEDVRQAYRSLNKEERARVYYKANLKEFLTLDHARSLLTKIAYSGITFIDPNEVPEELQKDVKKFVDIVVEFVGYKYSVFRYEDRTKYLSRAVTVVMDTDSNFINLGSLIDYIHSEILPFRFHKMDKKEKKEQDMRLVNTLCALTSEMVAQTLHHYLGIIHVPEEDRKHILMKNEFYYSIVIITFAKKSYIGLQVRQEGTIFKEPKLDVKGVNFFKSTASAGTSDFIYNDVLMDQLLMPKSGEISLDDTYRTIDAFQRRINEDIANGDMDYLKRSIRVKSADAYKFPMSSGQYRAVEMWNRIMEDERDHIQLPATVTLVKVLLRNMQDVAKLAPWPEIYNRVAYLFENDEDVIGDTKENMRKRLEEGKSFHPKGIRTLALPEDYDEVPDWVLAIIDVETLVEDNMKLFNQLYRPLGMSEGKTSVTGASARKYYTNIIRI